eukprot:1143600-Pelagomonas_calceolata.AAC.4
MEGLACCFVYDRMQASSKDQDLQISAQHGKFERIPRQAALSVIVLRITAPRHSMITADAQAHSGQQRRTYLAEAER